jgi:hypothetical protein
MASKLAHTYPHTAAVYQAKIAVLEAQISLLKAEMREKEQMAAQKTPLSPSPERERDEGPTRVKSAPPKSAPPAPKKQKVADAPKTDTPKATGATPRTIYFADEDVVSSRAQTNDTQPQSPLW